MKAKHIRIDHLKDMYFSLKAALQDHKLSSERLDETYKLCMKTVPVGEADTAKACLEKMSRLYSEYLIKGNYFEEN